MRFLVVTVIIVLQNLDEVGINQGARFCASLKNDTLLVFLRCVEKRGMECSKSATGLPWFRTAEESHRPFLLPGIRAIGFVCPG